MEYLIGSLICIAIFILSTFAFGAFVLLTVFFDTLKNKIIDNINNYPFENMLPDIDFSNINGLLRVDIEKEYNIFTYIITSRLILYFIDEKNLIEFVNTKGLIINSYSTVNNEVTLYYEDMLKVFTRDNKIERRKKIIDALL